MALDIKARFEPPAPITSPLEAYCAIGTIAKAMKLDKPARKDTLFDMRAQLDTDIGGDEPADERIGKLYRILMNFIRNDETTDQMMEYVTYGYEHEA
jgi:hypothetical protein